MKTAYYMQNKTTKEILPIWFKGLTGYHTAKLGENEKEFISWEEEGEWERIAKKDIPKCEKYPFENCLKVLDKAIKTLNNL